MAIVPKNLDPLADYVTPGNPVPITIDGLVLDNNYAYTGVIDTLTTATTNAFNDPLLNISNNSGNLLNFGKTQKSQWVSSLDYGATSPPVTLTYYLNNTVYYNSISFSVLNVPCLVEILDGNGNVLPNATFNILGGQEVPTTQNWIPVNYTPSSGTLVENNSLSVRLTRNRAVQILVNGNNYSNVAYNVGIKNFSIRLNIQNPGDFDAAVNGNSMIVQNRFGFVEDYSLNTDSVQNIFTNISGSNHSNDGVYWKSGPQPVQDAVVYFYAQTAALVTGKPQTVNRLYLDPLYSGCRLNVYYTNDTPANAGFTGLPATGQPFQLGTVVDSLDDATWTPLQRDFVLRKGLYEIPEVICGYLKFEFTQLVAEVYNLPFDNIQRTINVYPYSVENYYNQLELSIINGNNVAYSSINNKIVQHAPGNQLTGSTLFGVNANKVASVNDWPSLSALNNSQLGSSTVGINTSSYVVDPSISHKLINSDGSYNGLEFNQFLTRSFPNTCQHQYSQITLTQTWHQAYFTGVKYIAAFHQPSYDDLRATSYSLTQNQSSTQSFTNSDSCHITLGVDQSAYTPWFSTLDSFSSFNIAGLTTDWKSFLTDGQTLMTDDTVKQSQWYINASGVTSPTLNLGTSRIISVQGTVSGQKFGIRSQDYESPGNFVSYNDANFNPVYGLSNWSGAAGTTITGATVAVTGATFTGTVNTLSVSGASTNTAYYNFKIPGIYSPSGTKAWQVQFGAAPYGVVGYASYNPVTSGIGYYFTLGATSTSNGPSVSLSTRFVNSSTGATVTGTAVTGNTVTASSYHMATLTGTNYVVNIPADTIQLVVSGSAPFNLYQLGAFSSPNQPWVTTNNRSSTRIGGVARMYLPTSNVGHYRVSLFGTNTVTNLVQELTYKEYKPNTLPVNTWFDVELEYFTTINYVDFYVRVVELSGIVGEGNFYVSMLSPFYHPVRYEYLTTSGGTNWLPITLGVNDPSCLINTGVTSSGIATASGIQVRVTALDPNTFISGISIVPKYVQSPYYSNVSLDYVGSSKTGELDSRTPINQKPYFQLNKDLYPGRFRLSEIAPSTTSYTIN